MLALMPNECRLRRLLGVAAWLVVGFAVGVVVWGCRRGFDLTDEGFYLLTCTQPECYPRLDSGFNRLVAAAAGLTGTSVVALRLLGLGWLLVTNLAFALACQDWVKRAWPAVHKVSRGWMVPVMLLGVPASYLWAPQSPGYNAVVGGATLCGMAALLLCLGRGTVTTGLAAWSWIGFFVAGGSLALVAVAKLPACVGAALVYGGLILFGLGGQRWFKRGLALLTMAAGLAAGLLLIQITCLDVRSFLRGFLEVARVTSQGSHPPTKLLAAYAQQLGTSLSSLLRHFGWAAVLFFLLPELLTRRRLRRWGGDKWLVPGAVLLGVIALGTLLDHFRGANYNASAVQGWWVVLALGSALAAGAWWRRRILPRPQPDAGFRPAKTITAPEVPLVAGALLALPLAAAVGTNTHILAPSVYLAAAWFALVSVTIGTAMRQRVTRPAAALCLLLLFILVLTQFLYGHLHRPHRLAAPLTRQTEPVNSLSHAGGLRFDAPSAEFLNKLAAAYQQAHPTPAQPILGLYDVPGLVFLLGGRSPIPPWISSAAAARPQVLANLAAYGMELRHGASLPFLLLNEQLDKEMHDHLQQDGIPFPEGYQRVVSLACPWNGKLTELWIPQPSRTPTNQ